MASQETLSGCCVSHYWIFKPKELDSKASFIKSFLDGGFHVRNGGPNLIIAGPETGTKINEYFEGSKLQRSDLGNGDTLWFSAGAELDQFINAAKYEEANRLDIAEGRKPGELRVGDKVELPSLTGYYGVILSFQPKTGNVIPRLHYKSGEMYNDGRPYDNYGAGFPVSQCHRIRK